MGIVKHQCPHCEVQNVALQIVDAKIFGLHDLGTKRLSTFLRCGTCEMPIAAVLGPGTRPLLNPDMFDTEVSILLRDSREATSIGFSVDSMWPEPPKPRIPLHLNPRIEALLLQAERAFSRGDADAAVLMYGRTLEMALKLTFAGKGTLNQRITILVDNHTLPQTIGDWATEVRLIRNEAAHDDEPMDREDMIAIRNFTDAFLRYAITLPKEVALRRAETAPKGDAAPPPQLPPPAA